MNIFNFKGTKKLIPHLVLNFGAIVLLLLYSQEHIHLHCGPVSQKEQQCISHRCHILLHLSLAAARITVETALIGSPFTSIC